MSAPRGAAAVADFRALVPAGGERAALRATAIQAAREAGAIQRARRAAGALAVERKGAADITTDVDRACEARIAAIVRARHPDHALLGEEGTAGDAAPSPDTAFLWIVDPLDGTKNYAHGYRRSCVSVALAVAGEVALGVVFNPAADELFVAEAGGGATLNGAPVRASDTATLDRAMVASALTYAGRAADRAQLERLARVLGVAEAVRSDGCAALDLCDVACGRFDAYFEPGLAAWDTAAGALMVAEAGGRVTGLDGAPHDLYGRSTLASNGRVHAELLALVRA